MSRRLTEKEKFQQQFELQSNFDEMVDDFVSIAGYDEKDAMEAAHEVRKQDCDFTF